MEDQLFERIENVLDAYVRPTLLTHRGDLEVCDLDDEGTLWILMTGECAGCPSAIDTVAGLVEKELSFKYGPRRAGSWISAKRTVHSSGTNFSSLMHQHVIMP